MAAPARLPGDAQFEHAPLRGKASQPGRRLRGVGRALRHFSGAQRAKRAQHVGDGLGVPADPAGREPLQLALGLVDDERVKQLAQLCLAEQLG